MGLVTPAQREAFQRDGYVVVPGLLSPDELEGVILRRDIILRDAERRGAAASF